MISFVNFMLDFDSIKKVLWGGVRRVPPKLFRLLLALVVILVAVVLVSMGFKELQIGGLLSKIFGRTASNLKASGIVNTIDPDRVDQNGKVIPIGQPDSRGITQAVVVPIEGTGLFSDPKTVKIIPPGEEKAIDIVLPDGVTNKDVEQVILIKPGVVAVTVKDSSGVSAQEIDDLLRKYGG